MRFLCIGLAWFMYFIVSFILLFNLDFEFFILMLIIFFYFDLSFIGLLFLTGFSFYILLIFKAHSLLTFTPACCCFKLQLY